MNDDKSSDVEIERDDDIVVGAITGVVGGRVEAVEGDEIAIDVGVTTDVEPKVDGGRDSKLMVTVSSSIESSSDTLVGGICKEVGVATSLSSVEGAKGEGPGDKDGSGDSDGDGDRDGTGGSASGVAGDGTKDGTGEGARDGTGEGARDGTGDGAGDGAGDSAGDANAMGDKITVGEREGKGGNGGDATKDSGVRTYCGLGVTGSEGNDGNDGEGDRDGKD